MKLIVSTFDVYTGVICGALNSTISRGRTLVLMALVKRTFPNYMNYMIFNKPHQFFNFLGMLHNITILILHL
jgi:hypothetical protein